MWLHVLTRPLFATRASPGHENKTMISQAIYFWRDKWEHMLDGTAVYAFLQ